MQLEMISVTSEDNLSVSMGGNIEMNLYNSRSDNSWSFVDGRGKGLSSDKWLGDNDAGHVDAASQRNRSHSWWARDGRRHSRRPHDPRTLL